MKKKAKEAKKLEETSTNDGIIFDSQNYRTHSKLNKKIIKKSLDELGAGRSVLMDSENCLIAGNGVKEQWGNRPIKIVETDGSELIVVKRTDLKTQDKKRKKLALIDNHASDTSDFSFQEINKDFSAIELEEWNVKDKGYFQQVQKNIETFHEERIPYPITIVVDKKDYEEWMLIKKHLKIDKDIKAFKKILNLTQDQND